MLRYDLADLSPQSMQQLAAWQQEVDALPSTRQRYTHACKLFKNKSHATFKEVKEKLAAAAPMQSRCYYCEMDRFLDIEHIRPKRHYVKQCFDWKNYIYACAICNRHLKNDRFAVLDGQGQVIEFDGKWDINTPVPAGTQVLLDLRQENPLDCLRLDFTTGKLVPVGNAIQKKRAAWTRDLLDLNNAAFCVSRVNAFHSFKRYLRAYQQAQEEHDAAKAELALIEIRKQERSTVMAEIRRQAPRDSELMALLVGVPADIGAQ